VGDGAHKGAAVDVFDLHHGLIADYAAYVGSFIHIRDQRIGEYVRDSLARGHLWPEPSNRSTRTR
jgi:hypothetical protein